MKSMYNNQMQGRPVPGSLMQGNPGMNGQMPTNNMYTGYQTQHSQYAQTAYSNQMQMGGQMQNSYQQRRVAPAPNSNMQPVKPVQISSIKFNNANNIDNNSDKTVLIFDDMDKYVPQQQAVNQQNNIGYGIQNQQANIVPTNQNVPEIVIYGTSGEYADAAFSLEYPITFGRSKEKCNLIFDANASGVSRVHCKISARPDGDVLLQDLGSSYGVKVNGVTQVQPGESVVLSVGCNFTIGSNETFEICTVN